MDERRIDETRSLSDGDVRRAGARALERGVDQVAALWRPEDGDRRVRVAQYFIADPAMLDTTFTRFETASEQLYGHFLEIGRELRRNVDLDLGPLVPVDELFGGFDASAHLTDDLFKSKIAFVALLNFPLHARPAPRPGRGLVAAAVGRGAPHAAVRLSGCPPRSRANARAPAAAELYIAEYNIWMHHLVDATGERLFPAGMRLITHWNLRDELKADYARRATGSTSSA